MSADRRAMPSANRSQRIRLVPPGRFRLNPFVVNKTPPTAIMGVNPFALIGAFVRTVQNLLRPARSAAQGVIGAARDLTRTRSELLAENALLRQQMIVLRRGIRRPWIERDDRVLLLILARLCRRWRAALHIANPETLLR